MLYCERPNAEKKDNYGRRGDMRMPIISAFLCLFVFMALPAFAYREDRSVEAEVKRMTAELYPQIYATCKYNRDLFVTSKNRKQMCKDLDELGGQLIVDQNVLNKAKQWIEVNMSNVSRYYLKEIPKTKLLIDRQKKERQDMVMKVINLLRENVFYAYCQNAALGMKETRFNEIAAEYKKLMQLSAWRDIGERQNSKAGAAAIMLCKQIENIHFICIQAFDEILEQKRVYYALYSKAHLDSARTASALQRARKAEARAVVAENQAWSAQMSASAAQARAAEAEARAEEAEASANAANRRAQDAERKVMFGY